MQLLETTHEQPHYVNKIWSPKILSFSLAQIPNYKSCISPVLSGHCTTQRVCSATAWARGIARAQTHGYAGQDCISGRYGAARLSIMQLLQPSSSSTPCQGVAGPLPSPAPSKGGVAWGRTWELFQPLPWRGKKLLNPSPGHGLSTTKPHTRFFIFFPRQVKRFSAKQISDSKSSFLLFSSHAVLFEEWVMFQKPLSRLQCPNGNKHSSPPSNEGPSPHSAHI